MSSEISQPSGPRPGLWGDELLTAAAHRLGRQRWQMITMIYAGSLTQSEVAQRLRLPLNQVRSDVAASLQQIAGLVAATG